MKRWTLLGLATLAMGMALVGCSQEAQQKYGEAGDASKEAAAKTGEAVSTDAKKTGEAVAAGAENAAENVKNAADNAKEGVDAAGMTGKVKSAIVSASDLDSSDINVDTVDKKIMLKGSVPTEAEKKKAEMLAKGIAGKDYTVDDQLVVKPKS